MKRYRIQLTAVARRHVTAISEWWLGNRESAPLLFEEELAAAFEALAVTPRVGSPYHAPKPGGVRRLLLRKTGYWLYYTVHDQPAEVLIRAVWHGARGRGPRL